MQKKRFPGTLAGIAGVHYVVSELSMRGLIALPTVRNTAAYDIIVASSDGMHHKNLQVKGSSKRVNNWLMPPRRKIRAGPNDYYVLVRRLKDPPRFEAFLVSGKEASKKIRTHRRRRAVFYSLHVGGKWANEQRRWAKSWREWDGWG